MIKLRIQGLPAEVEKFTEQLKKDGYHFLMESDDYPNRNSEYVIGVCKKICGGNA
ncbi:hypothetical protein KQH97_07750 [Ruminococcus sp. MSJ-25]|jgi:hypothetical protein|uniref:hypothetical protein n=1 Tax=unclassified Ruminococcus TaxID=2608920 RepID=UPI0015F32958|nr:MULTISPECIES: hypothetical protein [unclassified Ruminococcus]MBU5408189.1 hypothetical protein [Ruminococcus sp. MSJ-25]